MRIAFTLENHSPNGEILLCEFLNEIPHPVKKRI